MAAISLTVVVVLALQSVVAHAHHVPARRAAHAAPAMHARAVTHRATAVADLDITAVRRHVMAIARLVGHRSRRLVNALGKAASVGQGNIEWNLSDLGIAAGATYGYASVVRGRITGVFFRGRASRAVLRRLKLPHGLQLTEAGGERPAFSIVAGD